LISAALAQSPNAASSTLCYLLRDFRHRSRESAQTLQTGRPRGTSGAREPSPLGLGLRLRPLAQVPAVMARRSAIRKPARASLPEPVLIGTWR
jgi:hypothetical protein